MALEQFDELYREVILDHYRDPRNVGELPQAAVKAVGQNPLCGDEIAFWLDIDGDRVKQAHFVGKGCAISQATGSMLTEQLRGKTVAEVRALISGLKGLMQGQQPAADLELGDLEALAGLRKFPVRVKCAALSWNVIEQGLEEHRLTGPGSNPASEVPHGNRTTDLGRAEADRRP